jgi:hypothetical protein
MLTVDDIIPLVGTILDERAIERLMGKRGQRSSDELDPGHPEDQRHYYEIPDYGLEMILGDGDVIETIFFHLRRKQASYDWRLRSGLSRDSSRSEALAAMGTPERSGKPDDESGCIGYDRFNVGNALLHFSYESDCRSIRLITAMSPATAPGGG